MKNNIYSENEAKVTVISLNSKDVILELCSDVKQKQIYVKNSFKIAEIFE